LGSSLSPGRQDSAIVPPRRLAGLVLSYSRTRPLIHSLPLRRGLGIAVCCSVLLFYVAFYTVLWPSAPISAPDTTDYIDLAQRLANHNWTEPHDRMLGYPLVLLAFGAGRSSPGRALFYFQLLAHAGGILVLTSALRRLRVSAGLCVAFAVLLLLPPFVDEAAMILTECLTGVLLAGMIYCLVRWQTHRLRVFLWMAGLLSGCAFLFRPVYLLLGVATTGVWLIAGHPRRLIRAAVPLIAPSVLIFSAVVAVQYVRFGYLGLTPKSGFMLFTRTLNVLERIPEEQAEIRELLIRHRDRSLTDRGSSHTGVMFMWGKEGALKELLHTTGKPATQLSQEMFRLNVNLIAHAPLEYLTVVANDVVGSWFPSATPLSFFGSRLVQLMWAALHFAIVGLYALSLCYFVTDLMVRATGRSAPSASSSLHPSTGLVEAVLHLSIWYTCILSSLVEVGGPRYMRPILPMAVMAIVLFVSRWKDWRHANTVTG
jgi:hypothetical protein